MNTTSRLITGIITIVLGLVLIIVALFNELWILIYGIPIFIIGLFILFNKREDRIEGRRDKLKTRKGGKK